LKRWKVGELELQHYYLSLTLDEKHKLLKLAYKIVKGDEARLYSLSIDTMHLARLIQQDTKQLSKDGGQYDK
jgi:hypothetical protein